LARHSRNQTVGSTAKQLVGSGIMLHGFIALGHQHRPVKGRYQEIPPHAVCHHQGARVASQRCPMLPDGHCILHDHAVALKR